MVASLVAEHGFQGAVALVVAAQGSAVVVHRLSCSTTGGTFLLRSGIEPMSSALADRFLPLSHEGSPGIWI